MSNKTITLQSNSGKTLRCQVGYGDFKRMSELTARPGINGTAHFSPDYVRKVLHGERNNDQIVEIALIYYGNIQRARQEIEVYLMANPIKLP